MGIQRVYSGDTIYSGVQWGCRRHTVGIWRVYRGYTEGIQRLYDKEGIQRVYSGNKEGIQRVFREYSVGTRVTKRLPTLKFAALAPKSSGLKPQKKLTFPF